jgi:antitoxin (DNA-binding transcriptional repressor) of toxin-antitoxin stability system
MNKHVAIDHDRHLEALVGEAERGETVLLTKNGRPVARIVADMIAIDRAGAEDAMRRILERSRGMSLRGLKIKDLINEGRP